LRRRFFVERFNAAFAVLRGPAAHHLGRVLRAELGQLYELSDGSGVWLARVERISRDAIEFHLVEPVPVRQPLLRLSLLLAVIKFDRFEWCLEKATELGVAEIVPLVAARSARPLVNASAKRAARWEKILLEAAQQARLLRPPVLHPATRPSAAFSVVGAGLDPRTGAKPSHGGTPVLPTCKIVLSERGEAPPIRSILAGRDASIGVLAIGPEGGWTDEELSAARAAGFAEASLGPSILRSETAVIAGLAIFNYSLGD
jgi:16S rRNA (uracil1498-N3)-methyltransferase